MVVASSKAKNAIYVSFRGTITTLAQWANNLKFTQVNWPGKNCPGCKVHKGFHEVFMQIRDPTIALIKKAAKLDKGSPKPHTDKVGKITRAQAEEIAKTKMPDLTAADLDAAVRTIAGSARSMGVTVEGV